MTSIQSIPATICLWVCASLLGCQYEPNVQGDMNPAGNIDLTGSPVQPSISSVTVAGLKTGAAGTLTILGLGLDNCTFSINGNQAIVSTDDSKNKTMRTLTIVQSDLDTNGLKGVSYLIAKTANGLISAPKLFSYRLEDPISFARSGIRNAGSMTSQIVAYADLDKTGQPATVYAGYKSAGPISIQAKTNGTISTPSGELLCALAVVDIDGDGFKDLVYATLNQYSSNNYKVNLFAHRGIDANQGYFEANPTTNFMLNQLNPILPTLVDDIGGGSNVSCRLSIADVDNNGNPDIILHGTSKGYIAQSIYLSR